LGDKNTLVVCVLLELVSRSNNTLDQLQGPPHFFVHGSRRPGAADAKDQGPAGGANHRKSDSTTNVVLQPDAVPVSIARVITWTRTVS